MSPEKFKKVEEIYHAVLQVSDKERRSFLQESCGSDVELRREVESLLSYENIFDSLIDAPPESLVAEMFSKDSTPQKTNIIGKQINQYKILSLLGAGGMGSVYLAQDAKLERKVAIKLLSDEFSKDATRRNRFFQEAKSASALNHPNILTVHEIGELDGTHFIVTEFIKGNTLMPHLTKEKPTLQIVLEIATQIASALTAAHEAGIIHRDIKPDNVMVRNDGIVKVLDFGIAKLANPQDFKEVDTESETRAKPMTLPGMIIGTPAYMSPEQARGQKVDLRSDIFSFGVVLYEMIAGSPPFSGATNIDTIGSILKDEPKPLSTYQPNISPNLENIVSKALRKDREQRYQHIKDLFIDLNDVKKTIELDAKLVHRTDISKAATTLNTTSGIVTQRRFSLIHLLLFLLLAGGIIGTISWFFPPLSNSNQIEQLKTEEVINWTSSPGEVYSIGSFSPDGKMVAFTSTKVGTKNIWIKQATSGEAIQITKDEFKNEQPIWSPNGEELAFFSAKGGEAGFWRIPILGGSAKFISKIEDGSSQLLFWSKANQIYYESNSELFAIDVNTGQSKQITNLASKGINGKSLSLSPDEKNIAYITFEGETTILWTSNLAGDTPKKLLDSANEIRNITWHPDNKRLFYSEAINGTFQIFMTDIYGIPPRQISISEQDSLVLNVSSDGSKILYGSTKEESDIWGFNVKDGKEFIAASDINSELWADVSPDIKTLAYQSIKHLSQGNNLFNGSIFTKISGTTNQPTELVKNGGLPKWSPDGKTLAFVRVIGDKHQIETVKPLGGEQKQLTTGGIISVSFSLLPYNRIQTSDFSWSPDSSKIAYISQKNGQPNIWLVNADGSNDVQLTENTDSKLNLYCPLWSSDGKKIVFTTKTNGSDGKPIYSVQKIEVETKKNDTILNWNTFIRLVEWSQNGNDLLLASIQGSGVFASPTEVSLLNVEISTGKTRQIVVLKDAYLFNIHLSPDKKTIAFVAHREDKDNIWIISSTGGEAKKMTANNDSRLYFSSLAWSPDSSSMFFGKQLRYSLLSMLTNFK